MTAMIFGVLAASLVGSVHCAGMCGPLVSVFAALPGDDATWSRRAAAHAAYSIGRLAGYALLGAVAGALGHTIDRAGALAGVGRAAAILSGALIALSGIHALASVRKAGDAPWAAAALRRGIGAILRASAGRTALARAALLGVGTALMPCGWLYAFVVTAAGTGGVALGALVMAVFWAGTLPIMVAFGETVRLLSGPVRRFVPAACAIVLIVLGLVTVFGRSAQVAASAAPPACHEGR